MCSARWPVPFKMGDTLPGGRLLMLRLIVNPHEACSKFGRGNLCEDEKHIMLLYKFQVASIT